MGPAARQGWQEEDDAPQGEVGTLTSVSRGSARPVTSMTKKMDDALRCPSAPATKGALLIGIVETDGRVVNLGTSLPVDDAFIKTVRIDGSPEERFRFSSPCQRDRCGHWKGHECGLIGELYESARQKSLIEKDAVSARGLPRCAIRANCRWWSQRGRDACAVCPLVVTDTEWLLESDSSGGPK